MSVGSIGSMGAMGSMVQMQQRLFVKADSYSDGFVSREEFTAIGKNMPAGG